MNLIKVHYAGEPYYINIDKIIALDKSDRTDDYSKSRITFGSKDFYADETNEYIIEKIICPITFI